MLQQIFPLPSSQYLKHTPTNSMQLQTSKNKIQFEFCRLMLHLLMQLLHSMKHNKIGTMFRSGVICAPPLICQLYNGRNKS